MDDLVQEFGSTSSVLLDNTSPAPSPQNQDARQSDNNNKSSSKPAPDKPASLGKSVAVSTMSAVTDLSEPQPPNYIKRFGHRNQPAVTPVILPAEEVSEESSPSSPTSSVDISAATATRPSDPRSSANDRLIDTASDTDVESDHHGTSDDAVAGRGQSSSNTESFDSDPQKHHLHSINQPREDSLKMKDAFAEQSVKLPLRSEHLDEAEVSDDDENDDENYDPANNKFYAPSRQTKASSEDESSAVQPDTPHSALHPTSEQPFRPSNEVRQQQHQSQSLTTELHQQPSLANTGNLARRLQAWRQQDTDRDNEFIAITENQCQLMTENQELRMEVAHLRSIINGNIEPEHTVETTSENPSSRNNSHLNSSAGRPGLVSPTSFQGLDSPTRHHPDDLYGGDASFEYDSNVPRPAFDGRSYASNAKASNANIPHVRDKWQSKEDKKALRLGTKVNDWQEVSRKKNSYTRTNPRLNGPILGAFKKTSTMRNRESPLYNAEGCRLDSPLNEVPEPLLGRISSMNDERRFCHSDARGRCNDRNCQYRHASDHIELAAIRVLFRRFPCAAKAKCHDAGCLFGHVCPNAGNCFKGSKCAWAATHNIDRKPAKEAQNGDNAEEEELISTAED